VDVSVYENAVCTENLGPNRNITFSPLEDSQLCAGDFNPARDSCQVNLLMIDNEYWFQI